MPPWAACRRSRHTGRCPTGSARSLVSWPLLIHSPATSTWTWRSSAPGSPACGPPITWRPRSRACASPSWSVRSPGSAPRGATAAGAPRCFPRPLPRWSGWPGTGRRGPTPAGTVRAEYVIRATEGYTPLLPGYRRAIAPVYSLMIATEPLPEATWEQIGLAGRPTFGDYRHLIIYGQRTADGRIAFGGRGAPYHLGSLIRPEYDRSPAVFAALQRSLTELFPVLRDTGLRDTGLRDTGLRDTGLRDTGLGDVAVAQAWGGPLGVPRDWCASAGLDRATGLGWAGGYVGDGVATTNLAGRTLADLVLGQDTELTHLPWVGHRSPDWEAEPLRWLGMNAGLRAMNWADRQEARTGRPSLVAQFAGRFLGS